MIELDGNYLEGGGAILRQALALSTITGQAFRINDIRKGRKDPGLKPQHLYCIKALEDLCDAHAKGHEIGATSVEFHPGDINAKNLKVDVKTAGSVTLLMQSLLIPCIFSKKRFHIELVGGTDVAWSQPIDYFMQVLLPQLARYADIKCSLLRRGYYPQGGGRVDIDIQGKYSYGEKLPALNLTDRGPLVEVGGISHASNHLEKQEVAKRQKHAALKTLGVMQVPMKLEAEYADSLSIGSGILLWARYSNAVILAGDSLGERGKSSEKVGEEAAINLLREMKSGACCDSYLSDQLIPFLALAPGSILKTSQITKHALSNIYVAEKFLNTKFEIKENTLRTGPAQ